MAIDNTSRRIEYIDFIRGISVLTIMFVHTGLQNYTYLLMKYFYSFQIVIFFFISGYLFDNLKDSFDLQEYVENRFKQCMIPYFVFSLINFHLLLARGERNFLRLFRNFCVANLDFGSIWFLPALFICFIDSVFLIAKVG